MSRVVCRDFILRQCLPPHLGYSQTPYNAPTMMKLILFLSLFATNNIAWPYALNPGLQVEIKREGELYFFTASFDTTLTKCAAYRYLTDYDEAKNFPGVLDLTTSRLSAQKVRVDRTVVEHVLFFDVRLHSIMEYTEIPFDRIEFTQLTGDLKLFQGSWDIVPNQQGSTLRVKGFLEPDTLIPLFIIDYFIKNGLVDKLNAIVQRAEQRKDKTADSCVN